MIRYISVVLFALLCPGCQGPIKFIDTDDGANKRVLGTDFDAFIVKDKEIFRNYHSLYILPLALDTMEINMDTDALVAKDWKLDAETKGIFLDYFSQAKSLYYEANREKRSLNVVDKVAPGVMAVEFRIKEFRPYTTRDASDMGDRVTEARGPSYGQLTLQITILDATSHEFIAYLLEGRHVSGAVYGFDRASQTQAWRSTLIKLFGNLDEAIGALRTDKRN